MQSASRLGVVRGSLSARRIIPSDLRVRWSSAVGGSHPAPPFRTNRICRPSLPPAPDLRQGRHRILPEHHRLLLKPHHCPLRIPPCGWILRHPNGRRPRRWSSSRLERLTQGRSWGRSGGRRGGAVWDLDTHPATPGDGRRRKRRPRIIPHLLKPSRHQDPSASTHCRQRSPPKREGTPCPPPEAPGFPQPWEGEEPQPVNLLLRSARSTPRPTALQKFPQPLYYFNS